MGPRIGLLKCRFYQETDFKCRFYHETEHLMADCPRKIQYQEQQQEQDLAPQVNSSWNQDDGFEKWL